MTYNLSTRIWLAQMKVDWSKDQSDLKELKDLAARTGNMGNVDKADRFIAEKTSALRREMAELQTLKAEQAESLKRAVVEAKRFAAALELNLESTEATGGKQTLLQAMQQLVDPDQSVRDNLLLVKECLIANKVEEMGKRKDAAARRGNMAEAKTTDALFRWMMELSKELNKQRDRLQTEGLEGAQRAFEERIKWEREQAMSFWKLKKELLLELQKLGKLGAEPEVDDSWEKIPKKDYCGRFDVKTIFLSSFNADNMQKVYEACKELDCNAFVLGEQNGVKMAWLKRVRRGGGSMLPDDSRYTLYVASYLEEIKDVVSASASLNGITATCGVEPRK